jgi:hypothetical protein
MKRVPLIGVIADPQSYLNIVFLLLGLPLGVAYFVFLVTGISVGFALTVVWVGVPILALVLFGSWAMCKFERGLANVLLKQDIARVNDSKDRDQLEDALPDLGTVERLFIGAWRRLKYHLSQRQTWTGLFYLFLRFPTGIASFVIAVVSIWVAGSLLAAPAYYWVEGGINLRGWRVDVIWEALALTGIGIPVAILALHIMNGTAALSGRFAKVMLQNRR